MAQSPTTNAAPVTEETFFKDRLSFWNSFCSATTAGAVAVIVLLLLMLIFLV